MTCPPAAYPPAAITPATTTPAATTPAATSRQIQDVQELLVHMDSANIERLPARYKRCHCEQQVYKNKVLWTLLFFTLVWVVLWIYRMVVSEGWNRAPPVVLGLLTSTLVCRTERAERAIKQIANKVYSLQPLLLVQCLPEHVTLVTCT